MNNNFYRTMYFLFMLCALASNTIMGLRNQVAVESRWLFSLIESTRLIQSLTFPSFILMISVTALCILKPIRVLRVLQFISVYIFFSALASSGKINHSYHAWLVTLPVLTFADKFKYLLPLAKSIVLSHYFSSGLWKLREADSLGYQYWLDAGLEHISYFIAEGKDVNSNVLNLALHYPDAIGVLLCLAVIWQLSCLIPIVFQRYYLFFALGIMLFHILTYFAVGLNFFPTIVCVFSVFILTDKKIKHLVIDKFCTSSCKNKST